MTHPDDITAYLKAKLEDRNPKCGNCKHWRCYPNHRDRGANKSAPFGICSVVTGEEYYGDVMEPIGAHKTTDLSLCSAWEKKE